MSLLETAASLSVASLSTVTLVGIITRPFKKRIESKIEEWDKMVRVVHHELIPNDGGSLKDQVTRMDARLQRVEETVDAPKRP